MTGMTYDASCACGNITVHFTTAIAPESWHVRTCGCAFCSQRPGHIHWSDPNGSVKFEISKPEKVDRRRHGTRTAEFIICAECDGYMGAVMESEEGHFAVLNIGHLTDDLALPERNPIVWQDEELETRLARRHKTWTPVTGDV